MNRLLIIGYVWPEPASSAAGRHMMEIVQIFLDQGWSITFASPAAQSAHQFDLSRIGVEQATIELNNKSFDSWVRQLLPDIVIFDRFMMEEQFGWRVAQQCPDAIRILDTEDLHFLRIARQQAIKRQETLSDNDLKNETAVREIASIYRCDLSLVISEVETQLLRECFKIPADLLHYLPFMINQPEPAVNAFRQRRDFVFVGTMRHAPNLDAVRYLKTTLWPKIRQRLPDASLHIVGSYLTKEISQMHKPAEGFVVVGKVDQLNLFLSDRRVSLVPLRFGAGLKGKLLEAMENGLPSVTTSIGAEGINAGMNWPGIIADDEPDLTDAAVNLYQDEMLWSNAQQQGYDVLQQRFSRQQHANRLIEKITEIAHDLSAHRLANFTGMMLQHHALRSTEYMARWIECKQKKGDSAD